MTRLSALPWIFVVCLSACTTVTPLQTASTVKPEVWRVGVQGSLTPACSVTDPTEIYGVFSGKSGAFKHCMVAPRGVPTPELRLSARRGLTEASDLGFSVHGSTVLPVGLLVGGTVDYKRELWSRPLGGDRRQLLSVGPEIGGAIEQLSSTGTLATPPQLYADLVLPLYFGHQFEHVELVASPRFIERFTRIERASNGASELLDNGYVGLSLGAFRRDPLQFGIALDYFAPTGLLAEGTFTLTAGIAYDFPPSPPPP
ncbi:MAG: hypothetical protein ACJ790_18885 [Myxococcaceae bacterium]